MGLRLRLPVIARGTRSHGSIQVAAAGTDSEAAGDRHCDRRPDGSSLARPSLGASFRGLGASGPPLRARARVTVSVRVTVTHGHCRGAAHPGAAATRAGRLGRAPALAVRVTARPLEPRPFNLVQPLTTRSAAAPGGPAGLQSRRNVRPRPENAAARRLLSGAPAHRGEPGRPAAAGRRRPEARPGADGALRLKRDRKGGPAVRARGGRRRGSRADPPPSQDSRPRPGPRREGQCQTQSPDGGPGGLVGARRRAPQHTSLVEGT